MFYRVSIRCLLAFAVGVLLLIAFVLCNGHSWYPTMSAPMSTPMSTPISTNYEQRANGDVCVPGLPCVYPETVDLRLIVLTFNRPKSLQIMLTSLESLVLDNHTAALEIFIDRNKDGVLHNETVRVVESFTWSLGQQRVHLQKEHVGIYGQWIDTWRPSPQSDELAIILEDDVDLSPFAYRWLRRSHQVHGDKTLLSGYCLQDSNVRIVQGKQIHKEVNQVNRDLLKKYPAYLFRVAGSWGFAPHPKQWSKFQDWFHSDAKALQHPYVARAQLNSNWYKTFERQHREDSMWTMWFIYFTDQRNLSALVSNVPLYTGQKSNSVSCNRVEPGLHFKARRRKIKCQNMLMKTWSDSFISSSGELPLIDYNGEFVGFR
ncbi:hypothetical protein CAPTEDRAFT_216276 [Capitella teleta]|uniref:Glycosyl transferase 64 domain-containing protein n=1 Tax=Capitella teleta TaxID=283909 RepID=R7UJU6_CAPTE|nr:hypothetical protein CAPTEDRAFT_216276 [Capitella teleta]|eukprot:ELU06378.1 hypothetical protein CAPTEDRAFT_216276 [Capitella teleta]